MHIMHPSPTKDSVPVTGDICRHADNIVGLTRSTDFQRTDGSRIHERQQVGKQCRQGYAETAAPEAQASTAESFYSACPFYSVKGSCEGAADDSD